MQLRIVGAQRQRALGEEARQVEVLSAAQIDPGEARECVEMLRVCGQRGAKGRLRERQLSELDVAAARSL